MAPRRSEETFYDVLKVDARATIAEIVAAYHSSRNAFSKDSVATYSLFSVDEAHSIIAKLDEAYHVLSNIDRKRAYDEDLKRRREENGQLDPLTPGEAARPGPRSTTSSESYQDLTPKPVFQSLPAYDSYKGETWKDIREKRGFSIEEVARITKIPSRAIIAVEAEDLRALPARVYLQGFLRNLAVLYRVDPKEVLSSYLKRIDELTKGTPS